MYFCIILFRQLRKRVGPSVRTLRKTNEVNVFGSLRLRWDKERKKTEGF